MTNREELVFIKDVTAVAMEHKTPVAFVHQLALTLLREGTPEPDMWGELETYIAAWNRRKSA